jgi:AmmeMemoRadiSam system protein A
MAPSPSPERTLDAARAEQLLDLAQRAIVDYLSHRPLALPSLEHLAPSLHDKVGAFVTLTVAGELQGCIGNVEGDEPVGVAVARLARSAASADPRFAPLQATQYPDLTIELSILSTPSPIVATTREALLEQLRPGIDGLIIADGRNRALFLPGVWTQLPDPASFVDHLFRKAGITTSGWPARLRAWRFTTQTCTRRVVEPRREPT